MKNTESRVLIFFTIAIITTVIAVIAKVFLPALSNYLFGFAGAMYLSDLIVDNNWHK